MQRKCLPVFHGGLSEGKYIVFWERCWALQLFALSLEISYIFFISLCSVTTSPYYRHSLWKYIGKKWEKLTGWKDRWMYVREWKEERFLFHKCAISCSVTCSEIIPYSTVKPCNCLEKCYQLNSIFFALTCPIWDQQIEIHKTNINTVLCLCLHSSYQQVDKWDNCIVHRMDSVIS